MENFRNKFIEEAQEYLINLEEALLELESSSEDKFLIEKVFRVMHSLKGGGAMFGFDEISGFTHHMESIYDKVRKGEMKLTQELFSVTLESVDHLRNLLKYDELPPEVKIQHNRIKERIIELAQFDETIVEKKSKDDKRRVKSFFIYFKPDDDILDNGTNPLFLIDELANIGKTLVFSKLDNTPLLENLDTSKCYAEWFVICTGEIEVNNITDIFLFVEDNCELKVEMIASCDMVGNGAVVAKIEQIFNKQGHLSADILLDIVDSTRESKNDCNVKNKVAERNISSIRVSTEKLDNVMNLVSELVTTQARLSLYATQNETPELVAIAENIQKLSRELRDNAFSIMLIPLESILTRFHRLVRDLNTELKKNVQLIVEGTDTELDKTIIESLTDPLLHIVRNSMDHGIELPAERVKKGKPEMGTIRMKAYYSGSYVHIEISDDGQGIDIERIRHKAIEQNIIKPDDIVGEDDLLNVIFMSGFSTASKVSDISGRGVGMDVVKRKISEIRGDVSVSSVLGQGTTIMIRLPLTLSIIDGLLVKVGETFFIIPLSVVLNIQAEANAMLEKSYTNSTVINKEQVLFYNLGQEFEEDYSRKTGFQMIIVNYSDKKIGLVVDSILGEYQAVLKPLGKYYEKQDFISGASILGDGTIALVLDTDKAISEFDNKKRKISQ